MLEVRVAWLDGELESSVSRTSYLFDLQTALGAYEEAGIPAFDPNALADTGNEDTAGSGEDEGEAP